MRATAPFTGYDRASLVPTVVHIGPGVFHRAHQAVYADAVLRTGATIGAIQAISLRSPSVRDALAPAGFVYHLIERTAGDDAGATADVRPIGALLGIDVAAEGVDGALARLVDPTVTVVTTTVTEHGYCAVHPGGPLDTARREIVHDLVSPTVPRSTPGLLLEALVRRRAAGVAPFTVACCDNLPMNGSSTARVVCELAEHRDPALAEWIRGNVAFPNSMVDRMVPATSTADHVLLDRLGVVDAWPVATEPFSQWVLEDAFPSGRPPWERVGVELVSDVAVYERTKLRVLNAAHSALAYWGLLAGHRYIWQAVGDPVLRDATWELLTDEVLPTLDPPPGWDLRTYAGQVLERFANRALPYTTAKVGGDGSQKLTVRLMPTALARLSRGGSVRRSAQVLAAWAACVGGPRASVIAIDDAGLTATPLALPVGTRTTPDLVVRALLARPGFLDGTSDPNGALRLEVVGHARDLWDGDVRAVLRAPPDHRPQVGDSTERLR